MSLPGEIKRRIQMLFHRDQLQRDLEEEIRLHLELSGQQQIDRGLPLTAAARAAHLKFGNTTRIKEKSLMVWGSDTLESFFADIAYGTRALLRSPALTIVALASLAFGIGANTAIFTSSMPSCCARFPSKILNSSSYWAKGACGESATTSP